MTTYTLPPSLSALIGPEIASYIERYVPTTLSEPQWRRTQPAVCELAARTEPISRTDARTVLSALCRFLAWVEPVTGSIDIETVLTAPLVERFADELEGEITAGARDNHRGRLRRCLRVRAGEPARTKRRPRRPGAAPYPGNVTNTEAAGIGTPAARRRATRVRDALGRPECLALILTTEQFTRRDLDNVMDHLPNTTDETTRELLRG